MGNGNNGDVVMTGGGVPPDDVRKNLKRKFNSNNPPGKGPAPKKLDAKVVAPPAPPVSGTKTICPSGCDYATLTAAISDVNTNGGATGAIVFELASTYVSTSETFPINPKITGASASNTITIRPATGATKIDLALRQCRGERLTC